MRLNSDNITLGKVACTDIQMATDNLVCAVCKGGVDIAVSHPKLKGVVVFSCVEHVEESKELLSRLLP